MTSQTTQTLPEAVPSVPRFRVTLRGISLVLVCVGLFISGYLSYTKLTGAIVPCVAGGAFNCGVVTNSAYSEIRGVPIAVLGFITYTITGVLLLLEPATPTTRDYVPLLTFGVVLFAFLYSMYLVYLQFFVLEALCSWCLSHEANQTVLFGLTLARTLRRL